MKKLSAILVAFLLLIAAAAYFAMYRFHRASVRPHAATPSVRTLTSADDLVLARVACGRDVSVDAKKTISCPVCPAGSDFAGEAGLPGGTGWTYDSALAGHFTASEADEVLVHASGCESHAKNFGGDFILRYGAGQWTVVRYASGATADGKCQKLPWQAGRDALICQTADMHQGIASDAAQFLIFDANPADDDFSNTVFLETTDESSNCGFESPLDGKTRTLQIGKIDEVKILPTAADGRQDVAVQTTIARVQAPKSTNGDCPKADPHTYRVVFHNMGDHFEAAGGYAELAALKREDCCEMVLNQKVRPGKY